MYRRKCSLNFLFDQKKGEIFRFFHGFWDRDLRETDSESDSVHINIISEYPDCHWFTFKKVYPSQNWELVPTCITYNLNQLCYNRIFMRFLKHPKRCAPVLYMGSNYHPINDSSRWIGRIIGVQIIECISVESLFTQLE